MYRYAVRIVGLPLLTLLFGVCGCTKPNPLYEGVGGKSGPDSSGADDSGREDGGPAGDMDPASSRAAVRFAVVALTEGSFAREDVPFVIEVTPLDAQGAPTPEYAGTLRLRSTRGDVFPRAVEITSMGAPSTIFRFPVRLNQEGKQVVIRVQDGDLVGESLPLEVRHGRWRPLPSPVLSWGSTGSWDSQDAGMAEVRPLGEELVLLYRGRPVRSAGAPDTLLGGIGRADSADGGTTWERHPGNPLLPDRYVSSSDFDNYSSPSFLIVEGGWWLFFSDENVRQLAIGHARSDEGLLWAIVGDGPALAPDPDQPRPQRWVHDPCVLPREGGGYEMWYSIRFSDSSQAIGHATSPDGLSWTPDEEPVLRPTAGAWDAVTVAQPIVVRHGSVFRMWYAGDATLKDFPAELGDPRDPDLTQAAHIGYATSRDGVRWEKSPDNPVLSPSGIAGAFDQYRVEHPSAALVGDVPVLFYSGFNGYRWRIGRAERPD
ncbi:MAG: hypothetical protein FJ125_10950 [Deltaproteobacteria bacterium]|nr:hypothetical protein [Deltaproteobacteria bacterium]